LSNVDKKFLFEDFTEQRDDILKIIRVVVAHQARKWGRGDAQTRRHGDGGF